MKANLLRSAFLIYLAFSVVACRSGVASPKVGIDVTSLTKTLSISSKFDAPGAPTATPASDTSKLLVNLPSLVD
ncbi:MAG TPA: hypothetical protein PK858_00345 [Saprospiraceae bacterium]|nr:hypothetical protein [Saprospiraceae bacterium]